MKRTITALIAGVVLGSTGLAVASTQGDSWVRNGVICTASTGHPPGIVCGVLNGKSQKIAVINRKQIIVGSHGKVIYFTSSR